MITRISIRMMFSMLVLCTLFSGHIQAAEYSAAIEYKQTMVKVLQESDVQGWPSGLTTTPRYPEFITVSADGSKVGFTVKLNVYSDRHIYVMNSDGSGLTDLTGNLPTGVTVGTPQMNETGSRLFCWDYGNGNIYYFDTVSPFGIHPAYKPDAFWVGIGSKRNYSVNNAGTVIYLNHSWRVGTVDHYGLVSTDVGTNILTPVVDAASLTPPKTADYSLAFLDAARSSRRLLLTYYPDYWHDNLKVMWESDPLQPMPGESHLHIWDSTSTGLQYCHVMSADGSKVLYNYQNTNSSKPELHILNLNTGAKTQLIQLVDGLDTMMFPALSPDGTIARWTSAGYKATRWTIATGDKRDTHSSRFPESYSIGNSSVTDITADNRYYFMGGGNAGSSYMHRIDMAPTTTAPAPDVVSINFGQSQLVYGDNTPIPITVQVSDPKGVGNIVSVQMAPLVDGRESPYGQIYEPLVYINPLTGGNGVYSGTVHPQIYSSIYSQLPRSVGVRIVVRNKDEHYVLADTSIMVVQQGTNTLSVTPSSRNVDKGSGTTTFGVSNTGTGTMQWSAAVTSGNSWLSIQSGSTGTNTGTITCAFTANTATASRTGTVRVTATGATGSPKDVTVTQSGMTSAQVTSLWPVNNAHAGNTSTLWANIKNIGGSAFPSNALVWYYVSGPNWTNYWVGYASVSGLTPGSTKWYSYNWHIPSTATPGTYTYWARVYQGNTALSNWSAAQSFTVGSKIKAEMVSPVNGSQLTSTTQTFTWTSVSGATQYWLSLGSTPGGYNIYNQSAGTLTSRTVTGLPSNGSMIYARLWTQYGGAWLYNDYSYKSH